MGTSESQPNGGTNFLRNLDKMLETHPEFPALERSALLDCLRACYDCAQACNACADACLGEPDPKAMARCIRLNQDCSNVCEATGKILARQTAFDPNMANAILQACVAACRLCGDECAKHAAKMQHCRVCADACRTCERACQTLLAA